MNTANELQKRMADKDDETLRAILSAPDDEYTPEARRAADVELTKRRLLRSNDGRSETPRSPADAWTVLPLPPTPVTEEEHLALKSHSHNGLLVPCFILAIVVGIVVSALAESAVGFIAGGVAAAVLFYTVSSSLYRTKLENLESDRLAAARREAENLRSRLLQTLRDSEALLLSVEQRQKAAANQLLLARQELAMTAYAPFWDAVERCASELGGIRMDLQMVADHAVAYAKALKGRRHTFPPLRRTIPVSDELNAIRTSFTDIVRQGQRDFQFAVIWEHRKTRDVLADGFRTLGEAVDGVSNAIHSTSNLLQTTLANGFSDVAAGHQRIEAYAAETAAAGRDVRNVISRYRLLG